MVLELEEGRRAGATVVYGQLATSAAGLCLNTRLDSAPHPPKHMTENLRFKVLGNSLNCDVLYLDCSFTQRCKRCTEPHRRQTRPL